MALNDYGIGYVLVNGAAAAEISSLERNTENGSTPIKTLQDGLTGKTPGSGQVTVTVNYFIPAGGTEYPYHDWCVQGAYVSIQIGWGQKAYISEGWITSVRESQAVDANAEGTFEWMGRPNTLQ